MNTPPSKGNISQYITKGTIGKGTFGKVKLGIHKTTGEKVAIKILEKSKITSKDDMERINREITILRNFSHLNVIKINDIFETKDNYVMQSTAFWAYAFVDENKWTELDETTSQFEWVKNFYDRFIKPLDDNTLLTILECKK